MSSGRCPLCCSSNYRYTRRDFLRGSTVLLAGPALLSSCSSLSQEKMVTEPMRPCGPASKYVPTIKAAFVRRKEEYGMWWPGAVYDGPAALKMYSKKMKSTAKKLGAKFDLRSVPIYSLAEAESWIAGAERENVDGMMLVMMDRQKHSWPSAQKVAKSSIPSIIYSPLGTSFTTNTIHLAETPGCVIYSTNDFSQAAYGMKMLCAAAKMRKTRCVVIKGRGRSETLLGDTGIKMRVVPATTFIEYYNQTADSKDIRAMADDYLRRARRVTGATKQDVINGVKSYYVAGKILENEQADAITMDCLGALGKIKVSLPCIAWSRMNDDGIPAACEADYGAVASHIITQYLFDRPGFQQDPVADTSDDSIIGAHCSCPTKLNGFNSGPEPFDLMHHHGNRDAVPRTLWLKGQRVTSIDLLPGKGDGTSETDTPSKVLISAGTVLENMDVPPSGGCVVSVKVKFDGNQEVLSFLRHHSCNMQVVHFHFLLNFYTCCHGFALLCGLYSRCVSHPLY
ncbi:MAG: hypothetical protein HQ580_02110, partial [Planctomycetes bacterium]|nr:hypothetical protein [Planctomycetota bacterium]